MEEEELSEDGGERSDDPPKASWQITAEQAGTRLDVFLAAGLRGRFPRRGAALDRTRGRKRRTERASTAGARSRTTACAPAIR